MNLGRATLIAVGFAAAACTQGADSSSQSAAQREDPRDATVFLRQRTMREGMNDLLVDVVVHGVPNLHGVALRLTWDPSLLHYVSSKNSLEWSKSALSLAQEAGSGQLLVAWAEKGETGLSAQGDLVLGSLRFEARAGTKAALAFKSERCQVVDKKGVAIRVAWRGSDVVLPTP